MLRHNYIGTEHILLGLVREEEGLAARVLASLGITLEEVRFQVARLIGLGDEVTIGQIPFTPRAKKVLELALREALSLGHNFIGTEHILLGVVRENQGVAARILLDFDADAEKIRNEIIRMLSGPGRRGQDSFPSYVEPNEIDEAMRARTIGDLVEPIRNRTLDELLSAMSRAKTSANNNHAPGQAALVWAAERCLLGVVATLTELIEHEPHPPVSSDDP